jgi:chromosome partitioning protein
MKVIPVIAVSNNKGGVGKSTITCILAEGGFFQRGLRVAVIDWDGQLNFCEKYIGTEYVTGVGKMPVENPLVNELIDNNDPLCRLFEKRSTITDIFNGKEVMPYPTQFCESEDSEALIDIIASSAPAIEALLESTPVSDDANPYSYLARFNTKDVVDHLVRFCSDQSLAESYDVIFIDCGPSISPLFKAALRAATHVICPYQPEDASVSGINGLINKVTEAMGERGKAGERSEPLKLLGFFPNSVISNNSSNYDEIARVMDITGDLHAPENILIRRLKAINEYTGPYDKRPPKKSLFKLPPSSSARQDVDPLVSFVFDKVFNG